MGKISQFDSFTICLPDGNLKCRSCEKKGVQKIFAGSGGKSNLGRHVKADHLDELNSIRLARPQPKQSRLPFAPLQEQAPIAGTSRSSDVRLCITYCTKSGNSYSS